MNDIKVRLENLRKEEKELKNELRKMGARMPQQTETRPPIDSPLREELEKLLGIYNDDSLDYNSNQSTEQPGDAEAFSKMIENTKRLPKREYHLQPEDPEKLVKRCQESIARFERLLLGRKGRKGIKHKRDKNIDESLPWTKEDDEIIKAWQPFQEIPVFPNDIEETRPSPNLPTEADQQLERFQICLYILRRAFLGNESNPRFSSPMNFFEHLEANGLINEDKLDFEDPWVALRGSSEIKEYLKKLENAGVVVELDTVLGEINEFRYEI